MTTAGTTSATRPSATTHPLSGARRGADTAYAVLSLLFLAALLVQVFLAGAGAFAHRSVQHPFAAHEDLGNVLGIVAVVLLVLALVAHVSKVTMIGAFVIALLTEVAQHGLAQGGDDNRWIGGAHAADGMIILLLAAWLAVAAYRRRFAR